MESLWKVIQRQPMTVIVGSDDNDVDFSGDSPSSVFFIFDSYQDKYTYLNWYSLVFYMYS